MYYIIAFLIAISLNLSAAMTPPVSISGENLLTGQTQTILFKDLDKQTQLKGTVVVFMSAKCPCSNSHVELIKKLSNQHKDFQFVVIHSNSDETKKEAEIYFKKANFTFAVLQDDAAQIADQFKAFKTPHAFVMNSKGELAYQGGVTDSSNADVATKQFLADALNQLSENKPVAVAQGRTLGCVILRKE